MDRVKRILYLHTIMKNKRDQRIAFFVAGLCAGLIILHNGMGVAGSQFVIPERKPTTVSMPIPDIKPLRDDIVSEGTIATDVPIPLRKPLSEIHNFTEISSSLSRKDQKLYKEIFLLQSQGKMEQAKKQIRELDNGLLMGHVLSQQYLHPATYSTFTDLKKWLDHYADHPQAEKIYDLADKRMPKDFSGTLKKPQTLPAIRGALGAVSRSGKAYHTKASRSGDQNAKVRTLERKIRTHVQNYEPTQAYNLLTSDPSTPLMDSVEQDRMLSLISAGYLYAGKLGEAQRYANAALKRSGQYVPMAGWVSGLVNWQREQYKKAANDFELSATSPYSSGWLVSASGYWASRAHMRAGNVRVVSKWLQLSASFPRTFYGLIATRALGQDYDFDWDHPSVTRNHKKAIEVSQAGQRAQALIQIDQIARAEAELRQLYKTDDPQLQEALLAYAYEYKLPALTMRLGHAVLKPKGGLYDAALYPVMPWEPASGYKLDKALIHAFIRQESKFDTSAESRSGATGLMQLMPATASYIAGKSIYKDKEGIYQLRDPRTNLEIGQTYLERLLSNKVVGQDLLSLAIAYNAGPGNLSRWKQERAHISDPLMFIETIPYAETRAFVERVLSNYWIYRLQMGQPTPSLDAVAEGRWARYAEADSGVRFAGK